MTIEEKIYAVLSGAAAITALVPAARIKPAGDWQNIARPYIVHRPISVEPIRTHDGGLLNHRIWPFYEVDVVSDDYPTGNAAAVAVRNNLDGVKSGGVHIFFSPGTWHIGRDPEKNVELFALQFRISEAL